ALGWWWSCGGSGVGRIQETCGGPSPPFPRSRHGPQRLKLFATADQPSSGLPSIAALRSSERTFPPPLPACRALVPAVNVIRLCGRTKAKQAPWASAFLRPRDRARLARPTRGGAARLRAAKTSTLIVHGTLEADRGGAFNKSSQHHGLSRESGRDGCGDEDDGT